MFIRLTLVAALMVFVSATTTNLRSVVEESVLLAEDVVVDNDFAAKVFSSFMKKSESLKMDTHGKNSKLGKLAMESKNMKTLNTELMELRQGGGEKYVSDGYYVQKRRANSDCSGTPELYFGKKLGNCQLVDTGSGFISARSTCVNNYHEGMVYELFEIYSTTDCSGAPFQVVPTNQPQPACGLDLDNYYETLSFSSQSNRCFPGTKGLDLPPGLFVTSHTDSNCQDQPIAYTNIALNTCSQSLNGNPEKLNSNSEYSSIKYISCSSTQIEIIMYSDRSCLRPIMKRTIKNNQFNGQCMQDGIDSFTKFSCSA